jgi:hypothetical protein
MSLCQWCEEGEHENCPGFVHVTSHPGPGAPLADTRPQPCTCPEDRPTHDNFVGDLPPSSDDTEAVDAWRIRQAARDAPSTPDEDDPATITTE